MPDSSSGFTPSIYTETVTPSSTSAPATASDAPPSTSAQPSAVADQIISRSYAPPSGGGGSGGPGFSVQEGVGIATALIPLVALFKGSGKSKSRPRVVQQRRQLSIQTPQGMNSRTKTALLIGGGILILGIGAIAIARK